MHFTFITLFPNLVLPYFEESILKRALDEGRFELSTLNPRDFSLDAHKKCDEYQCGGGAGLLMTPQPLFDAWSAAVSAAEERGQRAHTIVLAPAGKTFRQNDAKRLSKKSSLIFVCGRYEGMDERFVEACADEVFSVGDFVLTGGELPALCLADAIARNLQGVLGNAASLEMESFENSLLEAPSFTKPNIFQNVSVVSAFLKGNHTKIADLKKKMAECKTGFHRPDLMPLTSKDRK